MFQNNVKLKKILPIFFALVVLLQPFNKLRIITSFEINKAYIVANLCENRETPQGLDCAGRCYLKKQLAEAAEEEASKIPQSLKEKAEVWQVTPKIDFNFRVVGNFSVLTSQTFNSFYLLRKTNTCLADIFHPPSA